jgi:dCMP deaminase
MKKAVAAFLPVIQAGYLHFFGKYAQPGVERYVFGEDVVVRVDQELDYLRKEIRSLSPSAACSCLSSLFPTSPTGILTFDVCARLSQESYDLVFPDDDASRVLVENYFPQQGVTFDTSVFLRWDRKNTKVNKEITPDRIDSSADIIRQMSVAVCRSDASTDWWRQVGAAVVIADTREVVFASCNRHLPTPYTPYIDGDPRNTAHRGEGLDLYSSIHAEADLVAWAARTGTSLCGATVFVTTFPCRTCASLLAAAGISCLCYLEGYSTLDGEDTLRQKGVELVQVVF